MKDKSWSRRRFTKAIISAQAILASGLLVLPSGCVTEKKSDNGYPLNKDQQNTLRFAMDEIIPSNHKMPCASEIGGLTYVLNILAELPELIPLFIRLTDEIESKSLKLWENGFTKLKGEMRIGVLKTIEQENPLLFKPLKEFTYESYYTNEKVFPLIGYESYPTGTMGPEMEAFDEKLLERVKNIPPMYTKI